MPRDGAITFSDLVGKFDMLHVACDKCGRKYWKRRLSIGRIAMMRSLFGAIALVVFLSLVAAASDSPVPHKKSHVAKNHVNRHWHGYGFLPGYRPPEVVEREEHYYRLYGPQYYGPAWPGFYRGRWNGGGFGPCWTQTPIGPMWNCGK